MKIERAELKNFRNYETLSVDFHEKVNIFLGNNAQGKTNLLEAVYITALGRSFRTTKDAEMIRFGADHFRVRVDAVRGETQQELTVEIAVARGSAGRREGKGIKVDGVKLRKASELLENVYAVVFSPEDLRIVKDDPEKRRRFLDLELCQLSPAYYQNLSSYKRTLKQRNALLKDLRFPSAAANRDMLAIWDEKLAEYGAQIILRRDAFVEKLSIISRELHTGITNGKERLTVSYEPSVIPVAAFVQARPQATGPDAAFSVNAPYVAQKHRFLEELTARREIDLKYGSTDCGPHKDDLKISVDGIDIRRFGSQGQQRTAALSLKLAELKLIRQETGEDAILLLDDVLSELDPDRQKFLITSLGENQLFITATELSPELTEALPPGRIFTVSAGNLSVGV